MPHDYKADMTLMTKIILVSLYRCFFLKISAFANFGSFTEVSISCESRHVNMVKNKGRKGQL